MFVDAEIVPVGEDLCASPPSVQLDEHTQVQDRCTDRLSIVKLVVQPRKLISNSVGGVARPEKKTENTCMKILFDL